LAQHSRDPLPDVDSGMRDSIRKGMAEPLKKALKKPGW